MKRFLSMFLCVTLIFSTCVVCNLKSVSANSPATYPNLYFYDFITHMHDVDEEYCNNANYNAIERLKTLVETYQNNLRYNLFIITQGDNFAVRFCYNQSYDLPMYIRGYSTQGGEYELRMKDQTGNQYVKDFAWFCFYNNSYRLASASTTGTQDHTYSKREVYDFSRMSYLYIFPTPFEYEAEGFRCYTLRDVYGIGVGGSSNGMESNIQFTPVELPLDFVYFELGERCYLTLKQQDVVRLFDPEKMGYDFYIQFDSTSISMWQDIDMILDYETLLYLGDISNFVDYSQFTGLGQLTPEIYVDYIYAWDISEYKDSIITLGVVWGLDDNYESYTYGRCQNVPFTLSRGGGESNTQTESYIYINEYINNYPNENITPENLAVQMFGDKVTTAGVGCLSIPQNLYDYISNLHSWNTQCELPDHFEYKLSTGYYDPAETNILKFDLFSVCIVPSPQYWYESNRSSVKSDKINVYVWDDGTEATSQLNGRPKFASYLSIDEILDTYDCVIFLANNTWSDAVFSDFYASQVNDFIEHPTMAYTTATYNPYMDFDTLNYYGGAQNCFVVYTSHALQKNQLYLFTDSIRKIYDLATDYVEKRDLWDISFFSWSMSMFSSMQTLDGSINKIYDYLFGLNLNNYFQSVLDKLDQLVHNTDEQTHDFWILPLYNFVRTFVPSLTGFSNWIDAIEDFGEGMPELPMITVPALPTIEPTPYLLS